MIKKRKIHLYNTITCHSLTGAKLPFPDPRSAVLPANSPQFIQWTGPFPAMFPLPQFWWFSFTFFTEMLNILSWKGPQGSLSPTQRCMAHMQTIPGALVLLAPGSDQPALQTPHWQSMRQRGKISPCHRISMT